MIAFSFNDFSDFEARFSAIIAQARRPLGVLAVAGRTAANVLRRHFFQKNREEPNKLGGKRQHFWSQVAHSVQAPVLDAAGQSVSVTILHPVIAQKFFGGDITAKRVQNLAIPQTPEAYGRAPSVFERETGIKLIFIRSSGRALLAARIDPESKFLQVEYLLTPRVHQEPDPTALPDMDVLRLAVLEESQKALDRQLLEGGQS